MSLLPKTTKEFGTKQYWNSFFTSRGTDSFEWYGHYAELYGLLHTYIRPADTVLVAGCGNSSLSADLYRVGYKNLVNVDVSEVVIKQMRDKYSQQCPDMQWCQNDLTASSFSNESFSCVLDKGTLDALYTDDSQQARDTVDKYLQEVCRMLRVGGRYVVVSLLQEHILSHLLAWCHQKSWMVRVCRCEEAELATKRQGKFTLPVFMVICTKLCPMPNLTPVVESCLGGYGEAGGGGRPVRVSAEQLSGRVAAMQQYAAITHALLAKVGSGEEARLELCAGGDGGGAVRYVLYILDAPPSREKPALPMGVFLVPHGRECEWLFSSSEGRRQVCESAGAGRLVVVQMMRGQHYENGLQQVQDELNTRVMDFAPHNLPANFKVPYLSAGGDVGAVTVVHEGRSACCGRYVVEDVRVEGDARGDDHNDGGKGDGSGGGSTLRRLIFLDNPNVVQSEVMLAPISTEKLASEHNSSNNKNRRSGGKKKGKNQQHQSGGGGGGGKKKNGPCGFNHSYLSCSHHLAMVSGLGMLTSKEPRVMLVGLGGGPLATYIHNNLTKVRLEAVELDEAMEDVARRFFGFRTGPRLSVTVMDGLDYCRQQVVAGERYDAILLDVDCKDASVGMSCPPLAFLEPPFLATLAACLHHNNGVLIVNVVCRDSGVWQSCVDRLKRVFAGVICQAIPQDVNRVLFCTTAAPRLHHKDKQTRDAGDGVTDTNARVYTNEEKLMAQFSRGLTRINSMLKAKHTGKDILDVKNILHHVKIL